MLPSSWHSSTTIEKELRHGVNTNSIISHIPKRHLESNLSENDRTFLSHTHTLFTKAESCWSIEQTSTSGNKKKCMCVPYNNDIKLAISNIFKA